MNDSAVIFDFNGVLLWDAPLHVQAWQATARALRGTEMSDDEIRIHMHGRTNSHILGHLLGRPVRGKALLELTQSKETMYRDLCLAHPEIFELSPGARALLDFLAAKRIPITIATASEITNLEFFFARLGLAEWFEIERVVYDDGHIAGKPAPDMYALAAARLGMPPARCIVVEDAISGFQSAHAAGIGHIVALGPRGEHARLRACPEVSTVIESLAHFPRELLQS